MRRVFPLLAVVLILIGLYVFLSSPSQIAANRSNGPAQAAPTSGVQINATPVPSNVDLGSLGSPRVLAWNPNKTQLAWYSSKGGPVVVGNASAPTDIILTCGKTPAGDKALVFLGGSTAKLYLMPLDSGTVLTLASSIGLGCAIPGLTQFSPDGQRLGTINYDLTVGNQHYTQGTLKVLKLSDGSEQFSQDGVATFNLQNDGVAFLQFFTNTKNEANAADISFWDGSKTRKIEQNVQLLNKDPKKDCEFVTAKILRVDQNVYTMFGEHCTPGGTTWRLHVSAFNGGQAGTDIQSGPTPQNASFFYSADTNNMFLMPGNKQALVVLPNGGQSNLGDLNTLTLADGTIKGVVGSVEVANYPPTAPVRFLYSPKGDKLAFVTLTATAVEQLFIYDLNSPDKAPVAVPNAGGTNNGGVQDKVPGVAWSGDGSKLFFTVTGNTQALYSFDPSSSQSTMVARGTYSSLAVNNDGSAVATGESVSQGFNVKPLQNLVVISVSDGSKTNLVQGMKNDLPVVPVFVR